MPEAARVAVESGLAVTIHEDGCDRGKVGGYDRCTCTPRIVQPGARA